MRVIESAEFRQPPLIDRAQQQRESDNEHGRSKHQASLQIEDVEKLIDARITRKQSFADRKGFRQNGKENGLISKEYREARKQQRVRVESYSAKGNSRHRDRVARQAGRNQEQSGIKEKPARTVSEVKTKRSPSVSKCTEMRQVPFSSVRP